MTRHSSRLLAALGAALTFGLAACNDANAPIDSVLTRAQADSLALALTSDLDALPEGASYDFAGGVPLGAPSASAPEACVSRSPDPPTNSDGDPVPDSVRITFDNCSFTSRRGTVTVNGAIDILDMFPLVTGHSIRSVFHDLTRSVTGFEGGTFTTVENGTRTWAGSADQLSHTLVDFTTDVTFPNGSTASHVRNWSATFTADVPGTIQRDQPLPSGVFDVDGSSVWTHGDRSWSLELTTDPDLHYDAACDVRPKFDAGKVTVHVTRGDRESTVTIEFTACGQYIVTRS